MRPYGATLLRIVLGVLLVTHGYEGYFALETAGASLITLMGLPLGEALAWYVILAHVVGGLMMIVGVWTRWAALANVPVLLSTIVLFHIKEGFFMTGVIADRAAGTTRVVGFEYPLLVLAAAVALVFLGGGALAMTDDG